jgi:hypothetical protein
VTGFWRGLHRWQQLVSALIGAAALVVVAVIPVVLTRSSDGPPPSVPTTPASAGPGNPATLSPTTAPQPSSGPRPVLYAGKRDLAATYAADLDNPTWAVAGVSSQPPGGDIYFDAGGNLSRYHGEWGILRSQGGDGYEQCADFTAFAPSLVPVSGFGVGTRLCVRTSEGRVGLLVVRGTTGREFTEVISFDVTIWDTQ